jgi:hypothetical protein
MVNKEWRRDKIIDASWSDLYITNDKQYRPVLSGAYISKIPASIVIKELMNTRDYALSPAYIYRKILLI